MSAGGGAGVEVPAGTMAGDVIVLLERDVAITTPPANGVPSGFTLIGTQDDGSGVRSTASYGIAAGGEAGNPLGTGMTGGLAAERAIAVFRPDAPISSVGISAVGSEVTTGDPSAQTVLSGGAATPVIAFGAYGSRSPGTVSPRTFSPTKAGEVRADQVWGDSWLAWLIFNSSPSNVSVDMSDEGSLNQLMSWYLRFE